MDKKIDLNKIIETMNEKFSEGELSEVEKARYLYIELGKLFQYDMDYVSSSSIKMEDVYWREVDFDDIERNSYICRQMSEIYAELLNRVGIKARREYRKLEDDKYFGITGKHAYTVVELSDGRTIIADLVYDLSLIQKDMETLYFGKVTEKSDDIDVLSQEEIYEADRKIGYSYPLNSKRTAYGYSDEFYKMIRDELDNPEMLKEYIESTYPEAERSDVVSRYKLDAISRFFELKDMGFREAKMFLKKIYDEFFTEEEKEKIKRSDMITEFEKPNYIGHTQMIECFTLDRGEGVFDYYMYIPGNNLKKMTKEEIEAIIEKDGYKPFGSNSRIPGINEER